MKQSKGIISFQMLPVKKIKELNKDVHKTQLKLPNGMPLNRAWQSRMYGTI
jgi:hypothetical protein